MSTKANLTDVIEAIELWQAQQFQDSTPEGATRHLMQELLELDEMVEEVVDICFMAIQIRKLSGCSCDHDQELRPMTDVKASVRKVASIVLGNQISGYEQYDTDEVCRTVTDMLTASEIALDVLGYNLAEEMAAKLAKNQARDWPDQPDEHGVFNHAE